MDNTEWSVQIPDNLVVSLLNESVNRHEYGVKAFSAKSHYERVGGRRSGNQTGSFLITTTHRNRNVT
ncbi:hypothetical protein KIN20_009068 [Parelaphostrongylus tenuis]|uniref:Uncharacterized protein n=1 Tax=Parelaphostrongylus tenuis TaxID=148309 RepID=A0AAD5M5R0_PARTN|nr:hypothetical protein KIN20_009068 [Parelaphostrongylus tenuis]